MTRRAINLPATRGSTRHDLASRGIEGQAAEAFIESSGRDRHAARVRQFITAAHAEYQRIASRSSGTAIGSRRDAYAIAVLILDAFGIVAQNGPCGALQKVHHRAFRDGCGARVGPSAAATHAAARGAVDELWQSAWAIEHPVLKTRGHGPPAILIMPSTDPIGIKVKPSAIPAITLTVEPTEAMAAQPPSWLRTIALEGMRRGLRHEPWFQLRGERTPGPNEATPSPTIFDVVTIEGTAEQWATVLNAIIERQRVDDIAAQIVKLISSIRQREPLLWLPAWKPPCPRHVSLEYIQRWIEMAISDVAKSAPIVELTKTATSDDVRRAIGSALDPECFWISAHRERVGSIGAGHLTEPAQFRTLAVLLMLMSTVHEHGELPMAAAERAMRALGEYGTPVLSPDPLLGLQFDERPGVNIVDDVYGWPDDTLRFHAAGLCLRIATQLELHRGPGLYMAGARVIGTVAEWRAVAGILWPDLAPTIAPPEPTS